jgi:hypothetical protein
MFQSRFSRLLAVGVLAGSAALATVPLAGSASAVIVTNIKCKLVTGNLSTTVTLSNCSGNTGGASQPIPSSALQTGGTITWVNGQTTTVTLTVAVGVENDPGELKDCPVTSLEAEVTGTVTADTTGSAKVGGKVKAEACVDNTTGDITREPGTKLVIR